MPYQNVLETIGDTPIVRLNRVGKSCGAKLFAKLELTNPGGSIKDRLGRWLIEDAEKRGVLKPGGTIIEGTSGNTGFGLAITSAIKGYKCIFVLPDKMSDEKIKNLRAFGAKVIVTPTAVEPDDPRSYYSVCRRLAKEVPNSIYIDQYNNLANRDCHYKTTGPEILKQMPDVDIIIAGIGTGGTICGLGKFFKENKPDVKLVAVDPIGSLVYEYFKTGKMVPATSYKIEGIGEDFIPKNYDFSVVDDMVQVEDKESFLMTRELLTKEGIYVGVSSGSAVVGAVRWIKSQGDKLKGKNVLIILPDSGNRYISKVFDDEWMREAGFLESNMGTVDDILHVVRPKDVVTASQGDRISAVVERMRDRGISQLPVMDEKKWIKGVVQEGHILSALYEGKVSANDEVSALVDPSVEFVTPDDPFEKVSQIVHGNKFPIVTDPSQDNKLVAILTKIDLLTYLGNRNL